MAEEFPLPAYLKKRGWRVKIADKEIAETPHATVLFKIKRWRWDLRNERFMDAAPPAREVSDEIVEFLKKKRLALCKAWDKMYGHNPVGVGKGKL